MSRPARTCLYLVASTVALWWSGYAAGRGHWSMLLGPVVLPFLGWGFGGGIEFRHDERDGAV